MKKRLLVTAVAGVFAAQPAVMAASEIDARIDAALDSARAQHNEEMATALAEAELAWSINDGATLGAGEEQASFGMY